jgi:nitrogen fixation/metabolism regulation signal transduction histidine kinase
MVENLEDSKRALAQSEKETAWREMAKQVAHEIKNPLTPMKLTLQQLENALQSGDLSMDKAKKSVGVLLKQVEILNSISISFSTFANMPAPSPQVVDLWQLLSGSVMLFDAADEGSVRLLPVGRALKVSVDPISFSRVVSNVIINALQSKRDGQEDFGVSIDLSEKANYAVIAVRDNGKGMSQEVQEKIFEPHFTTKKSGSGLGLAMAKQIVTQAGGRIGFESVLNQGTTFLIELPLLSDGSKSVILPLKSK